MQCYKKTKAAHLNRLSYERGKEDVASHLSHCKLKIISSYHLEGLYSWPMKVCPINSNLIKNKNYL